MDRYRRDTTLHCVAQESLEGNFGKLPVGTKAASPLYLRKSSAFPTDTTQDQRGSAADPRHSLEEVGGDSTAKQSFAANRQAEPEKAAATYRVIGEPTDLHDAQQLATEDRYQFLYWALSLLQAGPLSKRRLWNENSIWESCSYVNNEQGDKLPDFDWW